MRRLWLIPALMAGFLMVAPGEPSKPLHPKYPVIEGFYRMSEDWALTLDQKYNRRIEDGRLVIWRPGFTIWTRIWGTKEGETPEQTLKSKKEGISDKATDVKEEKAGDLLMISYRLAEASEDKRRPAFHSFAVGPGGLVQMSIYFDDEKEVEKARQVFRSLKPVDSRKKGDGLPVPSVPEQPGRE